MALHPFDAFVLIAYLAGITALGSWMGRRISGSSEYFMPRRFGKATMIMHAFGTGTASDQAVSVASATAQHGLSGIWFQWQWLFSTPFYWIIAPIMRRFRAITTADVYALRYDQSVSMLFALVGIVSMAVKIGLMLKGAGALIDSGTGGLVSANFAIPLVTILFVVYGVAGGLGGAIMTDFVQGLMTILFSVMLLPVMLYEVGGLDGVRTTIAAADFDKDMLSLVAPGNMGFFYITMLSINSLFLIVAVPSVMGNCAAGRTEMDGRIGFMCGTFVKRICTIAWSLTAIAAVAWYVRNDIPIDPDEVYGDVAYRFLPAMAPGLLGIFIASLLASVMSSCDSFMIASSGLFTENIYRVLFPHHSERHYVWVGRASSLMVVIAGLVLAYSFRDVVEGLKVWLKVGPMMGIAFWLGLLWRRATVAGAWASTLAGFSMWWLVTRPAFAQWAQTLPLSDKIGFVSTSTDKTVIADPWQMAMYLTTGITAGIVVSLLSPAIDRKRLDLFYALTRTPVQPNEPADIPCTLPDGTAPAERTMLLTAGGLEIPCPSITTVVGFAAGWASIAALIGGFAWLVG